METLTAQQRRQLVDYKNKLLDEAQQDYVLASIEEDKTTELLLLKESSLKEKIATEIGVIIYGA